MKSRSKIALSHPTPPPDSPAFTVSDDGTVAIDAALYRQLDDNGREVLVREATRAGSEQSRRYAEEQELKKAKADEFVSRDRTPAILVELRQQTAYLQCIAASLQSLAHRAASVDGMTVTGAQAEHPRGGDIANLGEPARTGADPASLDIGNAPEGGGAP